ncbi:MAG: lysophospholipase [Gemmatimonadales bacterium]
MSHRSLPTVEHREGSFFGYGQISLFYQAWVSTAATPRAMLVNLHGLGDHSGLYPALTEYFPARGIPVYAFDMRGNGRSPGQRAYLSGWHEYRGDLHAFLARVREWEPDLPLFVLGNSLGGLVVLEYALHYPEGMDGVIAAAPALGDVGVPPLLMALGRVMSRIWPRFSLEVGMDLSGLARDPNVVEALVTDPLFHRRGTARLATEVTSAIARVQSQAAGLSVPLLILHGSEDRMVPPGGSRRFFSRLRLADRQFLEYPGAYHALFADLDYEKVLGDLERWMEGHLEAQSRRIPHPERSEGMR